MNDSNITDTENNNSDIEIDNFINSLDLLNTNITKNRKTIADIEKECDRKHQHFHIEPHEFDEIYDPEYNYWTDSFNAVCDNLSIIKRMIKRKMFVNLQHKLLGCSSARYVNKFNLEAPEIELCDIINFINDKLKPIRPKYHYSVYIDICQDSKFYVGISNSSYLDNSIEATSDNMAKKRLESHRDNGGGICPTNFTYMYPVISCLISFYGNKEDEDLITILMSKCVGNNVRGGIYVDSFKKPKYPDYTIDEIKEKLLNRILI